MVKKPLSTVGPAVIILPLVLLWCTVSLRSHAAERQKLNFNAGWLLRLGDFASASQPAFDDSSWQQVTLPLAFNGDEAFRKDIADLTDTVAWYRKHFVLSASEVKGKVFIEFEGVRQGADFFLNGQPLGFSENGVMACGFDLTPYAREGENVLAVRCDNSWTYRSRVHDSRYQWNDRNFNANYGGIPKNVYLHLTDKVYQTLPLYSNLGTTGTYVYATDFDIPLREATIHVESQVRNDDDRAHSVGLMFRMRDADGNTVATADGEEAVELRPGETRTLKVAARVGNLHFWSWGYGYLYTVETRLREVASNGSHIAFNDPVTIRTGFRKTAFHDGMFYLNDRVMMVHGYAQRTSNEWPGVGLSVPAWLSDYSNGLMVASGGNLVRWMHVTPWKQDVESCDRVGLLQAMPAGDAEKDVDGPRWQQRVELMRDAIIYNRNNPSIIFYEGGNESISREHMLQLKAIRDQYDPHGGRAIGSREMLDISEAEYGGEMLYINKSGGKPMWAMEYCRDEGLRKYWDEQSYPFHKEGDGPLYRGNPALEYNHNMDRFACQMVERWHEYWLERPGTGRRVSSGGVKIVFSDTNTHHRGESNYRTSGVVDAMRIPKDAFFAHQVMWNGWVEPETPQTYIIGHWSYEATAGTQVTKPVYVVSNADSVELFLNGRSLGMGRQSFRYLFTFDSVTFEPGTLKAVGYHHPSALTSEYSLETVGQPFQLKLTAVENPLGTQADGADMVLVQVEVVDRQGRRCPLDNRMAHFQLWGEARWIGGIGVGAPDNYVGRMSLPVECGVNRILLRTTTTAGEIGIGVQADGLRPAYLTLKSTPVDNAPSSILSARLPCRLGRGETPLSPSYVDVKRGVRVVSVTAGSNSDDSGNSFDDNELTEWRSDGQLENAWITCRLERTAVVSELALKLTGWRNKCYPLEVWAGKKKVWAGVTPPTLGYVHLYFSQPVKTDRLTIRMTGPSEDSAKFGQVKELAGGQAGTLDGTASTPSSSPKRKVELRIVELDVMETLQ